MARNVCSQNNCAYKHVNKKCNAKMWNEEEMVHSINAFYKKSLLHKDNRQNANVTYFTQRMLETFAQTGDVSTGTVC